VTALAARRYLAEYLRRPLNVVLLVAVPTVFVTLSAGALADFAELIGRGGASGDRIVPATAGWAAAALAGIGALFHVGGSRAADRRLAMAGARPLRVVTARLASGLAIAALAASGGLGALALRGDVKDLPGVVGGVAIFAVIYFGIGSTVGALVRSELNGSLLIVFIWMFDVFIGPAMGEVGTVGRAFPLHFPTLVITDAASGHAGPFGDLGISLAWAGGSLLMAVGALLLTTRARSTSLTPAWAQRIGAGLRFGFRDYRRNVALWVLLVTLPLMFISLSIVVTRDSPAPVELVENGRRGLQLLSMVDLHGAIMVPITIGFLSGLAGMFVVLGSAEGDRRLALAGFRPPEVLVARLGIVVLASLLATAASLLVTAVSFEPEQWPAFAGGNLLVALTYAWIGVLIGSVFGKIGGLYLMLLLPFIDIGLAQNAMFDAAPPAYAAFLPAHGAVRVILDGSFTANFDEAGALALAALWLLGLQIAASAVFYRVAAPQRA
jgi:hypothetical protein